MDDLSGRKPAIVIYSNCQGMDLIRLVRSAPTLAASLDIRLLQFHLIDHGEEVLTPDLFDNCIYVWEQLGTDYPQHREQMHALRPPTAKVVTFPSLNMLSLWPFTGGDARIRKEPMYQIGRYPWSDVVGAELGANPQFRNLSDAELLKLYFQHTTKKMPDLDRRLAIDVMRWRERDAACDVKLADYLLENFRKIQLFYTFARPSPHCSGMILKQLLAESLADTNQLTTAVTELDHLLRFFVGYDMEECPIHPAVAEHFGLEWYKAEAGHRHHAHRLSFNEYMVRYLRFDPYVG